MSKWKEIDNPPDKPIMVELFSGNMKEIHDQHNKAYPPDPVRDHRRSLGYWDGKCFRFSATGHEIDDDCYLQPKWLPTHYRILPTVPEM
jgi:hypothetical protein